jgi:cell division protein FtsZ
MSFNSFGAKIKVVGVGGGGGNAVNTMIRGGLEGVDFIVANTDAQALKASLAPHKIQLGKELTKGLGAGADPDIGRDAALEDRMELQEYLSDADMVFITAGMGGGTGTGAAAVVAQIARELGALTVAVVTKPFAFEGKRRRKHAEHGVARLRECVDTLITIPNQRLLQVATPDLSMLDAFKLADNVLVNAVRGISDIINTPGLINVDFADVKTVMSSMGHALMGIGYGTGAERALSAAKQAISSPLLEDIDIEGATGILINITAGTNVSIMEVNNACMVIQEAAHDDANIIFGAVIDETLGDEIRITVIATGFPVEEAVHPEELTSVSTRQSHVSKPLNPAPAQRLVAPPRLTTPVVAAAAPRERVPAVQPTTASHTAHQIIRPQAAPTPIVNQAPTPVASTSSQIFDARLQHPASHVQSNSATSTPATVLPNRGPLHAPVTPANTPEFRESPAVAPASATPALHLQNVETVAQPSVAPCRVDAASEAQSLADWTFDECLDTLDDSEQTSVNTQRSSHSYPDASVFDQPDETSNTAAEFADEVFAQDVSEISTNSGVSTDASMHASKTVADMVFASDEESIAPTSDYRAGAIKDVTASWDFDPPTPDVVSDEIDRRIDEALALAEQMNAFDQPEFGATQGGAGIDLDDLDLPAFLRSNSETKSI